MTPSRFTSFSAFHGRCLTGALLLSSLLMGSKAQAQIIVYVAETANTGDAMSLQEFSVDITPTTGSASLVQTFTPTGIFGGTTISNGATESDLSLSGDGTMLGYAGFNGTTGTPKSVEVLFNLSTQTFDTSTVLTSGTVRANFTQNGSSFYTATAGTTIGLGLVNKGGTSLTSVSTPANVSVNGVAYNSASNNLFFSRVASAGSNEVYMSPGGSGLITSSTTFTPITGTGWNTSTTYNGLGFLGANTLFVANVTANQLDVFGSTGSSTPTVWNQKFTPLSIGSTEDIQQLSVYQIDANDADIFFTTDSGIAGGNSTFDEVSYNSTTGFGTIEVLGQSTTDTFSGIVAIPEPGTYALFGLGLGLIGLMSLRRKVGKEICPK